MMPTYQDGLDRLANSPLHKVPLTSWFDNATAPVLCKPVQSEKALSQKIEALDLERELRQKELA